jgi:hypothetical protein
MAFRSHPAFFAISVLLAACSSSSSSTGSDSGSDTGTTGDPPGSCNAGKNSCSPGTAFCCADYAGNFRASTVKSDCDIAAGTYSPSVCPSANREGSCTLYPGTVAEKTIRYYAGYDAASSSDPAKNCAALHGTYTPG